MKLNYKSLGVGKPLIIAHGLFGSLDNWMTLGKSLSEFYEVFLIDLRNHGRSPHSDEMSYEFMSKDIHGFIQEMSLEEPAIIGHSMGGKAAMQLALSHPDSIKKLIVIDIGTRAYQPHHDHIIAGLRSLDLQNLNSRSQAETILSEHIEEPGTRQFLLKGLYRKEQQRFGLRYNLEGIAGNIDQVSMEISGDPSHIPSLFIRGERSNYIVDSDIPEIEDLFPNSSIETIPDAGHWVHADQPQELLNRLLTFLIFS